MYDKDYTIVRLMQETIEKIFKYTSDLRTAEEFENDSESFDAVIMNFIVLGESISKLTLTFKDRHPEIDWQKIYAFRNVLAHDYFGILPEEVWQIIKKHLPKLQIDLQNLIDK
jgi:uncharacterized protein with HEPN domain